MGLKTGRGVELLQGEAFVLEPSAVHNSVVTNQAGVNQWNLYGERARYLFHLNVTAAATVAGDTLDVFIDCTAPDLSWINCIHFPQVLGNGGALAYYAVLDASNPGTACIAVATDAAVNTVRPAMFGQSFRVRYTVVNVGGVSFTFAVQGYAIGSRV